MAKKNRRKQKARAGNSEGKSGDQTQGSPSGSGRASAGASAEDKAGDKGKRPENTLLEWVKSLAIALVLFLIIRSFLVHTFVIISGSMEETLLVGDLLLVNRAAVGSRVPGTPWRIPGYSSPERGDILVFDPPHEENMKLVKRLMGLPGDTLSMRDKVLFVNGNALEETYVQHQDPAGDDTSSMMSWQREYVLEDRLDGQYRPSRDNWGPIVVPPDHYFMLGDNRDTSLDSRYWGLLESWRLEGRAVVVYFSYNKDSFRPFPWLREIRWRRIGDLIR